MLLNTNNGSVVKLGVKNTKFNYNKNTKFNYNTIVVKK